MHETDGEGADEMSGYVLHLPEEESVVLSGPVVRRLLREGDGDAALLYIAVLRNKGVVDEDELARLLPWQPQRIGRALEALSRQGLAARPDGRPAAPVREPERAQTAPGDQRPEYTRADLARAMEGREFAALTAAVEEKLGKKLTTPDLGLLLGLYDDLGLPADVIFLLVGFCVERSAAQYGPGRRPTMRQIEREGYTWARLGLMTQEAASAHIRRQAEARQKLPQMMRLLGLGDRKPSPSEEKYLTAWSGMGFSPEALELAYDKTVLKCKELKWPYMNRILASWHQKGLHTLEEIRAGDRPAGPSGPPQRRQETGNVREDLARMEKYLEKLRREKAERGES